MTGQFVKIRQFSGIACYVRGPVKVFSPGMCYAVDRDTGEEFETESDDPDDGEWIADESQLRVVMVGDDREWIVDADECTPIEENEFCGECGQMGCFHGRE